MASRFLAGLFAPVTEEVTAFDLPVTGRIPPELNGRYLRNGPNAMGLEDPDSYHWFLGKGMVHGIRLRDGRAEWYRNRWIRSESVANTLGEKWSGGPVFADMDWAPNNNVIEHAGRTITLAEGGARPYEMSYDLGTLGPCDFGGLPGGYTAHPKRDPRTGELHAVSYFHGWNHVQHIVLDRGGHIARTVNVPVSDGPMMHDFALTERYVVIYDLSITFSADLAVNGARLPYAWNDAHPSRIGLLPRDGGADEVRWFDVEPCWVFHTLNAYDDAAGRVVVEVARYPWMLDQGRLDEIPPTVLDRWTIDPAAGTLRQDVIDDRSQEYPRVDERVVSLPHRYSYTVVGEDIFGAKVGEVMLKRDARTETTETRLFPRGSGVGEAVFVPTRADSAEDDGYLMTIVFDPERGAADLLLLSARDFTGPPVAAVHLPAKVPLGFHGSWIPDPEDHR
ncbi:carotenoid oxygenase family protein [Embleya hyalina]|uniref:Dioxygenase n=1 Tax=Embleya hyalina TaxID=516124 RepID=A0A401Z542_9ACTN|nr:carotenoid oxygenase family protein [Embleya hyalina]GCE01957.1 carotenoid cleavage dioxygenase [Embleya hyalina]